MEKRLDISFLRERAVLRRMALVTVAFALAGMLYGMLGPRWYTSTVTLAPVRTPSGGGGALSTLLGGEMGGLATSLAGLGGASADTNRIAAVLQSAAVSDVVVGKFGLLERYDARYVESARDALWKHCGVRTLAKPNLVQLSCEDREPAVAQQMVATFADVGNQVFRQASTSSASEEVRFLERRVAELRKQADEAAARVREFQETHQIVDLDSQARAVVSSVATLNSQRLAKQLELDYARTFASRDEASSRQLEAQLSVVDERLRDLELPQAPAGEPKARAGGSKGKGSGLFPAALAVPRLRAEYERLFRDRKVAEATLVFSLDRLEAAKAAEARDVSTFQVLDPATLPTRKTRPRTAESTANGAIAGLLLAAAVEWWRARRARADT